MTRLVRKKDEIDIDDYKIDYLIACFNRLRADLNIKTKDNTVSKSSAVKLFRLLHRKGCNYYSIGERYIWNYTSFIFMKRLRKGFKFSWLTSISSIQLWVDKELDWYFYHGKWLLEHNLTRPKVGVDEVNVRLQEDDYRKKYLNTIKGFIICIENTSLIDPESRVCRKCYKKLDCKELLKANKPELHKERYGGTE